MNPHHEANMAIAQGLGTVKLLAAIERTEGLTAEDMPPPLATGERRRDWSLATFRFELGRRQEAARVEAERHWVCCGVPVSTVGLDIKCMGACGRISR